MKRKVHPWIVVFVLWLCGGIAIGQTEQSLVISDGESGSYNSPMDWRMAESHYQLFYPSSVLNLPAGAVITSLSFNYSSYGDDLSGGDIQIRLGETEMTSSTGMSAPLDNSTWKLCYEGSHLLSPNIFDQSVTYSFNNNSYSLVGGKTLVIDITNEGSPRTNPNMDSGTYFDSNDIEGVWSWNDYEQRVWNSAPEIIITYTYAGDSAILYIPFTDRICNSGVIPVGTSKTLTCPVTNQGSSALKIDSYQSDVLTVSAVTVEPSQTTTLSFVVKPKSACSFSETIQLQSNGGSASFRIFGTTYQMPKADTFVELDASTSLKDLVTDYTIQELSISGLMTIEDMQYLSKNFSRLIYLDLSQAEWPEDYFYYHDDCVFQNVLQRLSLPCNIESVSSSSFISKCVNLRQLVLPVGLESFSTDLSGCLLLNSLVSLAPVPPSLDNSNVKTVYVPHGCIADYQESWRYRDMTIEEIDDAALKGEARPIKQIDIKENQSSYYSDMLVNYRETEFHTRLFVPSYLLNLPSGSTIDGLSFDFHVNNYDNITCESSMLTIAVGWADSKEEALNQTSFTPFYVGSDQIDLAKTEQVQTITYPSTTPFIYNGRGIVVDITSTRISAVENSVWIGNPVNQLEDYEYWVYRTNGISEEFPKPNLSIHFSTEKSDPILFVEADHHKQIVGFAPVNGSSAVKWMPIHNLGATDLVVSNMTGSSSFVMTPSTVTIAAHSSGLVGFSFQPTDSGTVEEKICLQSNGGQSYIHLVGSTLRRTPYWHNVTVSSNYSLYDYFSSNGFLCDTVTALSVTGSLTSLDWFRIYYQMPSLKYLDLSTATIPTTFYSFSFKKPENIEQLALPLNIEDRVDLDSFVNLQYLMYPISTEIVYMDVFDHCPYLNTLVVLASTPPDVRNNYNENGITRVYVPTSAVDDYKQSDWLFNGGSEREILPITSEVLGGDVEVGIPTIVVRNHREYNASNYPTGKRSVWVSPYAEELVHYEPDEVPTASLQVKQSTPLLVDTLGLTYPINTRIFGEWDRSSYASFINSSTDMTVDNLQLHMKMYHFYYWVFFSVPFQMPLANLQAKEYITDPPINYPIRSFVIRTYDGRLRAEKGSSENSDNWRKLTVEDQLEPGKGYIFQSSYRIDSLLFTPDDPMDYINKSVTDQTVSVEHFASANESDSNWNLIGNPYFAFYDIHKMGYSAPIIVRDVENYVALSPVDDDYALRPLEAFFVQVPDEVYEIRFPWDGQQTTPYISTTRSALRASMNRQVFNLRLMQDGKNDRSRVVLNPEAKGAYEVQCDAAKWMSESDTVPQLYTLDHIGTKYAINERPVGNGIVPLGVRAAADGEMTISLTGDPGSLRLYDKELKREVDLSEGDYTFIARKGTIENRFELRVSSVTANELVAPESVRVYANGSQLVVEAPAQMAVAVYSTAGVLLRQTTMSATRWSCPLSAGIYVVRVGNTNHKVIIY